MKNRYKNIALTVLLSTGLCGCSDMLDNVKPDTSIPVPNVTNAELPLMAKGMYARLSQGLYYMSSFADDVASDNLTSVYEIANNINFKQFDDCNVGSNDGLISYRMFNFPYNGIGLANIIINFVTDENPADQTVRTAKGEAYLMRGYCYMLLAERFGKAVISYGTKGEEMLRTQNPEPEVWQRAIDDLKSAIKLLPEYTTPNSGSVQAAKAILARLYLNYGMFTNNAQMVSDAGTLAQEVIDNGGKLSLNPDFKQNFMSTGTGKEVIWHLVETTSDPTKYGLYQMLSPRNYNGQPYGSTWMEESLYVLYNEPSDIRLKTVDVQFYSAMNSSYPYCVKYPADTHPIWSFVRLSEMHLIVSEVDARKGIVDVTGYNAVRLIRNASTKSNSNFANAGVFLKEIENERRREFVAEGLRWMDMRRFGSMTAHLESKGVDSRKVHFPISYTILSKNPKLVQTEYYN